MPNAISRCFILSLILLPSSGIARAQDAIALQESAVKRIERCVAHLRKTGNLQPVLDEVGRAEDELRRSTLDFIKRGENAAAALSLNKLADLQRFQNRWQEAKDFSRQAYELANRANHTGYKARALVGQARAAYVGLKEYDAAIALLDEALKLTEQGIAPRDLFDIYDLKSSALSSRGELAAAFDLASRALAIAVESGDPELLFYGYFSRGGIYQELGRKCDDKRSVRHCLEAMDRAKSDLDRAVQFGQQQGYDFLVKQLSSMLSHIRTGKEMLQDADTHTETLMKFGLLNPVKPGDVMVTEKFAEPSRFPAAFEALLAGEGQLFGDDAIGLHAQAALLHSRGQVEPALALYQRAVERLERDRRKFGDETGRSALLEDQMQIYLDPALVLLHMGRRDEAFELVERSRSRVLSDLLQTRELQFTQPADRAFHAESVRLHSAISRSQKELLNLRGAGAEPNAAKVAAAEREIQRLEAEYRTLTAKMAAAGSKLPELIVSQPASLSRLQQLMKKEGFETLVYVVRNDQLVLWHISGDASRARSVFLLREHLIKKAARLRASLKDRNAAFDEKTARELFLFLVQPALDWIKSDRLVIIPHDDLHYIPFQALIAPDGRALGDRFALSYAPSATVLLQMKKSEPIRLGRLLAIADPGSVEMQDEVTTLGRLFPQTSRVISKTLVKESELKAMAGGYDLLHLSVHGRFVAEEPLLSHLKLAPGPNDDGQLTAAEMFGLPLQNAKLVTLSACDTGQAQATRAGEVIGMVRALLYAGAGTIVLSSWEVDAASTAQWMETFYREAQVKTPAGAARAALIAVKKDPRYAHPYFWSPFLLIGR
jgi:CHAT domain-containing protein